MRQRLREAVNRVRESLFYVPAGFVVGSLAVAVLAARTIPAVVEVGGPAVESSRVILTTIAGATITVAGIVFSITLVALQLSATQFSTRVLQGFLRDRFSQVVIASPARPATASTTCCRTQPERHRRPRWTRTACPTASPPPCAPPTTGGCNTSRAGARRRRQ